MHVWRGKLEGYLVFFECFADFFTAFIVEDVKFRGVAIGLELERKCLPTGCKFCCLASLDRVRENQVLIVVIEDHDVQISAG